MVSSPAINLGPITFHSLEVSDQASHHVGHTVTINQEKDKLLKHLRVTDPRDDKKRIERTAGGILRGSYCWVLGNDEFVDWRDHANTAVLWVSGNPGKGKTMLLCGIIDELQKSETSINLSFFFCQATDSSLNTATSVLRGIIYLLALQQDSLESHVRKKYDAAGHPLFSDPNAWDALSEILASMLRDAALRPTYLIIDAIDECRAGDMPLLLEFIKQSSSLSKVKWVLSSRNNDSIEKRLALAVNPAIKRLSLEQNAARVSEAVDHYIDNSLSNLLSLQDDLDLKDDIGWALKNGSQGTFLWVALVVKELGGDVNEWDMVAVIKEMPSNLKDLYGQMLQKIHALQRGDPEYCRLALRAVVSAFRPLRIDTLCELSGLPQQIRERPKYVEKIVKMCQCFLTIEDGVVYIVHQSAKDFLQDTLFKPVHGEKDYAQASSPALEIGASGDTRGQHEAMFSRSLAMMSTTLHRNMYGIHLPGQSIDQVKVPDEDPLASVSYSCIYWIDHLVHSRCMTSDNLEKVDQFLRQSYIYWLEALSLLKHVPGGLLSIVELDRFIHDRLAHVAHVAHGHKER